MKGEYQVAVSKVKLDESQVLRLINTINITKPIRSAYLCKVNGTNVKKIAINYTNGEKESFYPMEDDMEFVINGITLTRKAN